MVDHDEVGKGEFGRQLTKHFAGMALDAIPVHRPTRVPARDGEAKPGRRLLNVVRTDEKQRIRDAPAATKDVLEFAAL